MPKLKPLSQVIFSSLVWVELWARTADKSGLSEGDRGQVHGHSPHSTGGQKEGEILKNSRPVKLPAGRVIHQIRTGIDFHLNTVW